MKNKIKDPRYDLTGELPDSEDEAFSTDFDVDVNPADTEIYRQYKIMQLNVKVDQKHVDEQLEILRKGVQANSLNDDEKVRLRSELLDKKFAQKKFEMEIEQHIAQIRIRSQMNRIDPVDLVQNNHGLPDPLLGVESGFEPFSQLSEEAKNDPLIPTQLRKILNRIEPELQNLFNPIFDETSRQEYLDVNELKLRLFEAKWQWYLDKKMSQVRLTTNEIEEERSYAEEYDAWIRPRVEYMYDYLDFDNERY